MVPAQPQPYVKSLKDFKIIEIFPATLWALAQIVIARDCEGGASNCRKAVRQF